MATDSVLDERTLRELYLTGFKIAVKEGHPKAIMTSYNLVNGVYANENTHLITELLRDQWGFDGFVVTDWGGDNDHVAGVKAGSDLAKHIVFTGPVDAYFDYCLGPLEYRSVRFETEVLDTPNYQGNAVINYTDRETPYTRVIEHKWFDPGDQPKTVISREYSAVWKPGDEPYYPVNDEKNGALYQKYKALADAEPNTSFAGRLGEYRYYDMDVVVAEALKRAKALLAEN